MALSSAHIESQAAVNTVILLIRRVLALWDIERAHRRFVFDEASPE